MRQDRFKYDYRQTSSRLHKKVGDTLRSPDGYFANRKIYQEYPVNKINPTYPNAAHKFDWVVLDLFLVIECHGQQHYATVGFGGVDKEEQETKLHLQKRRDLVKQQAAEDAGFTYVVVPFWDYNKINQDYLLALYDDQKNAARLRKSLPRRKNSYQVELEERSRAYRKSQYQKQKEYLKQRRRSRNGSKQDD